MKISRDEAITGMWNLKEIIYDHGIQKLGAHETLKLIKDHLWHLLPHVNNITGVKKNRKYNLKILRQIFMFVSSCIATKSNYYV